MRSVRLRYGGLHADGVLGHWAKDIDVVHIYDNIWDREVSDCIMKSQLQSQKYNLFHSRIGPHEVDAK